MHLSTKKYLKFSKRLVGSVVEYMLSVREVLGSIPGPVKSNTMPSPLRRFFGVVLSR